MNIVPGRTPLWVIGAVLGAFAAVVTLGPQTIGPALVIAGGAVGWVVWRRWSAASAERSVLRGLQAHWASLPGATWRRDVISVHHGDRPIEVRLSHEAGRLRARIATPIAAQPMAFRIWPRGNTPPELRAAGGSAPDLKRSELVEGWLSDRFGVESNDEERLVVAVGESVVTALVSVADALGDGFEGVLYDGQTIAVALGGPVVADPERAAQLARVVWRPFVP